MGNGPVSRMFLPNRNLVTERLQYVAALASRTPMGPGTVLPPPPRLVPRAIFLRPWKL